VLILVLVWDWDWFIPQVESRASNALGRPVSIAHLHVRLGRNLGLVAEGVQIDNPPGFPQTAPLAHIARLRVDVSYADYLEGHGLVIPRVALGHPVVNAVQTADRADNYTLHPAASAGGDGPAVKIGTVQISDGQVHAVIPKLKADFQIALATQGEGEAARIVAKAQGTYAGQPVTGEFTGGALLSLRDASHPYPVRLLLKNGETGLVVDGTVADPLNFKGANITVDLAGASMADLYHLTAVPAPRTPRYRIIGKVEYAGGKLLLNDVVGRIGESDVEGTIAMVPGARESDGKDVPDVAIDLQSRSVNLLDFGGLVRSKPAADTHRAGVLPDEPFDIPRLQSADIHLRYRGEHIQGRFVPLDNVDVHANVVNGVITVRPFSFGVGHGKIDGDVALTPQGGKQLHTTADIHFDAVDVSRLMAATHMFHGAGSIGGRARLDAVGHSIASLAANGNGGVDFYMAGGNLSALLVDLSGLQFGNALLSALGLPQQTPVKCLAGVFALDHGIVETRALVLDTGEGIIGGSGKIDLRDERINYRLETKPKNITIGSLPTPIDIDGTLKNPSIHPEAKSLAARGAAAAVLGVLAAPLALLPTIQFGTADPQACGTLVAESKAQSQTGQVGAPVSHTPKVGAQP
jgi:uncharacterized protein involved in outer membrane biogenesis